MKISTIKISALLSTIFTRKLGIVAITVLLLISPMVLLAYNPINLPSAKRYIISSIEKNMPQYQADVEEVSLYWDGDLYLPTVVVKNLQIKDNDRIELSLEKFSVLPTITGLTSFPPKPPISIYLDKFEINLDNLSNQKSKESKDLAEIIPKYIKKLKQFPAAKVTLRECNVIYHGHKINIHRLSLTAGNSLHLRMAPTAQDDLSAIDVKIDISKKGLSLQGSLYENSPIAAQLNYDDSSFAIDASCHSIVTRHILNLWPHFLASGTRKWLEESLLEGELQHANFNMQAVKEGSGNGFKITNLLSEIHITDAVVYYLKDAPLLKDLDAVITLTADAADIKAQKASLNNIPLENLSANITNMGKEDAELVVKGSISADLAETIELASMYSRKKHHIDGPKMKGNAITDLYYKLPFNSLDKKKLKVVSALKDVEINNISGSHNITAKELVADYQNFVLTVKGGAVIDEVVKADITYILPTDAESFSQKTVIKLLATPELFTSLGFSPPSFLKKAVPIEYSRLEGVDGVQNFLSIQLDDIKIIHPILKKGSIDTKGGTLKTEIEQTPEGDFLLKNYDLETSSLSSKGNVLLKKDYTVASIESEQTLMGGSDLKFSYQNTDYLRSLLLKGKSLDLSVLSLEEMFKSKETNSKPFQLRSKLNKIIMHNSQVLTQPELNFNCSSGLCTELKLKGNLTSKGSLNININYPDFAFYSDNAGDSLRALNLYTNMHGGLLSATAKSGSVMTKGSISIHDYYLIKTPILSKLLSITSISSISLRGLADMIQGKGINFRRLTCPVTFSGGVLTLEKCLQEGSVMSMTGEGSINMVTQDVDVKGVITPHNIINSLFKHLPVFNKIVGKKSGGFLAVNYTTKGSLKTKVIVSTNPLSILAPGFLKRLGGSKNK